MSHLRTRTARQPVWNSTDEFAALHYGPELPFNFLYSEFPRVVEALLSSSALEGVCQLVPPQVSLRSWFLLPPKLRNTTAAAAFHLTISSLISQLAVLRYVRLRLLTPLSQRGKTYKSLETGRFRLLPSSSLLKEPGQILAIPPKFSRQRKSCGDVSSPRK